MSNNLKAILLVMLVTLANAFIWVMVRQVSSDISPFQTVFFSNFFAFTLFIPWVVKNGISAMKTDKLKYYGLRALVEVTAFSLLFYSITMVPLATSTALQFLSPLMVVILSIVITGEKIKYDTWVVLCAGLVGVWMVARPGTDSFHPGALLSVGSAVFFAFAPMIIQKLVVTEPTTRLACYFCLLMALFCLPFALMDWRMTPTGMTLVYCILMGVCSVIAQLSIGRALALASVTVVMPFFFMNLIFTTALAYVLFDETPDLFAFIGGGLILSGAIFGMIKHAKPAQ